MTNQEIKKRLASLETVKNVKSNNAGRVVSRYNRISDNKEVLQVITWNGTKAFWLKEHTIGA